MGTEQNDDHNHHHHEEDHEQLTMSLDQRASKIEMKIKNISGRVMHLNSTLEILRDELTIQLNELRLLEKEDRNNANKNEHIINARLVFNGNGPGGQLGGFITPTKHGKFISYFLGSAVNLVSRKTEDRLRLKEDYVNFRQNCTIMYVMFPLILFSWYNSKHSGHFFFMNHIVKGSESYQFVETFLTASYPIALQAYFSWLLYFYTALGLRENILKANGSNIRPWWIQHHYYSMGMALCVLTMDVESPSCVTFIGRFLFFTICQGVVMHLQNRYQRFRMYTRVAVGKSSPMDVSSIESGSRLKLLWPLLLFLQSMQLVFGCQVLIKWFKEYARNGHGLKEWQALVAGSLFVIMALGNGNSTIMTFIRKRNFGINEAKKKKKL
jgi:hypothetical protein